MPKEIRNKDEFKKLVEHATEVRVVKSGDSAKVKVRTPAALFTFKTTAEEADALTKGVKAPILEFG